MVNVKERSGCMISRENLILILREYKATNENIYGIRRLGLFGSAARGEMHEDSDIDVVVELKEPDLLILADIKTDLEEQLGMRVDIVRHRKDMNINLKRRISREAVYV